MLSFTRRRLIVLSVFIALAIFAGFKFGPGSLAAKPKSSAMLGGPLITATMTAAPVTDVGSNGAFVNPGDTLEYTVTLNNTGDPATDVSFTDNLTDANLTLVPGSVKASPIAGNDTYPVTGNVRISTANGAASLLANDIRPTTGTNTGLTITTLAGDNTAAFAGTSAQGGQVTAATGDGSFAYNPAPGFEGADSFTYTVTDPDGLTATGTVNITVTGMIWFVQAGAPAGGDGRLSTPFNCLVGAGCFDPVAADGAGDNIFLYSGAYTGGLTLLGTQKLIGQGATTTLAGITGITLATGSDPLPALGGVRPTVTTSVAATNGINLGLGNTLRGFDIGNTTASDISGVSFGTLTASEIDLNGTGRTLNLTTGTLAATFGAITSTSSSGGPGMSLASIDGNLTVTGAVSITGSSSQGISIASSTLNSTFGSTTVANSATQSILIGTHTVGTLAFGNTTVTGGTDGVSLQNNASGLRTFGTLNVSGVSVSGLVHGTGGGNTTVSGTATLNAADTAIVVTNPSSGSTINFQGATSTTTAAAGQNGVSWTAGAGSTASMTFSSLNIQRNNGIALNATGGGTINVTNATGSITGTTADGSAIVATLVALNANFAAINCSGVGGGGNPSCVNLSNVTGTSNFGTGTLSGATGATFLISGGTCSTTYLGNVTQANNAPVVSITGHSAGTVNFLNGPGTVGATNGTGLQFDNADGLYNFNGITTLNGGDAGIDIVNGSAGSFVFNGSTSITNPSGIAFRQDASNASVTYGGTISKNNNANHAVDINGKTSGSTTFARSGGQIAASTDTANAIDLTNTGGSIAFSGGLAITTTSGIGFNATGAGQTVNVCDENPCNPAATGVVINTIASTTGTALNVSGTTIGSNNLEFQRIASSGAPSGIILNATGAGGLKVTGTGVLNSGGVISSSTGPGVLLTAVQNINLSFMSIQNSGDDGIRGSSVVNFTMADTNVISNGNAVGERGIEMTNLTGTASITNSSLTGNAEDNLFVSNSTGTLSSFNITGSTFSNTSGSIGNDGIHFEGVTGAPNMSINVSSCTFSNNRGDHFQATTDAANTANLDVTFQNNTMTGSPSNLGAGITINTGGNSTTNFDIVNNGTAGTPMMGAVSSAITINSVQNANLNGNITGNFIGNAAAPDSGSLQGDGINVAANATSDIIVLIANNTIRQYSNLAGINVAARDNFGSPGGGTVNATISNNTIANPGTFASNGILVQSGAVAGDDHFMCANIGGVTPNSIVGSGANGGSDFRVRQRFSTTFRLPGYGGGGADTAAVVTFIQAQNTGAETGTATTQAPGSYTIGAACAQPPAAPPPGDKAMSFTGDQKVTSVAVAAVERTVVGGEIVAATTGWELAHASASVETTDTAIWQQAIAEVTTTDVVPVANTPSLLAEVYDKVTSQISPTVYSQETTKQAPEAGTVTVNGSGSGFALPTNKSTTITFRATISNPTTPVNTFAVSNQGSVSGTGFTTVQTDGDAGTAGAQPTTTVVVQPPTITKSFTPANILLDQQSTLTLTINNTNPAQAVTGITVTDVFPANVVVASPLTASTTCGAGTLQNNSGGVLAVGDPGIKLVGGTRAAAQSCTVTVKVRGTVGGTYLNTTGNVASFEGFVGTTASSTLNVSVLTASELSISGRVTTAEGRGIRGAVVTITGNSLTSPINVITGINGTYSVEGLAAGETYIVTVRSRRFAFESPSRVVTLIDNVTDADFIGSAGTNREQ